MMGTELDYDEKFSRIGIGIRSNPIRKLTALLGNKDVISLAAGAPSPETFPLEELAEIASRVIRERGPMALQYGPTKGPPALVEGVVGILQARGIESASTEEVVMTSGSQQGLDLIARVILDPGDVALVELPSYIGGIIAIHNSGAEMAGVRQDDDGIVIDDLLEKLDRALSDGRRVKCIYTIPNFQNPSGVTLSNERRHHLVEIADQYDLLIIEDDAYFDLYFDSEGSRRVPLAALRPERVIYLGTFSKTLAPGFRAAYLRAPRAIARRIELAKEGADLSSSVLDQAIVAEAIRSGLIDRRLPELRKFYQTRCRAMLEALTRFAPAGARWTKPVGGFFILLELDGDVDANELLPRAIESGVAYVPGQPFFVDESGPNTIRLAYSKESPQAITDGIERMCRVMAAR